MTQPVTVSKTVHSFPKTRLLGLRTTPSISRSVRQFWRPWTRPAGHTLDIANAPSAGFGSILPKNVALWFETLTRRGDKDTTVTFGSTFSILHIMTSNMYRDPLLS